MLITGSKGFIGTFLVEFFSQDILYKDWEIDTIDLNGGDDVICKDVADFRPVKKYDVVIHLAAFADIRNSLDDPDRFWENNVEKAKGIFKYCEVNNVRLLYASSAGAKDWWLNPYATSKKVNEIQAPYNSVGMRFFNVYGHYSREDMLFRMLEQGTAKYLTRHKRDWIHVYDLAQAIARLIPTDIVGTVDIGNGYSTSVLDLAKEFGMEDLPIKEDTPGEPDELCADITKLKEGTDWIITYDVLEFAKQRYQEIQGHFKDESPELETPQQEGEEEET